jgi:hypothetical protein
MHMGRPKGSRHRAPAVFISWAHRDSSMTDAQASSWREVVRALAERLNASGCVVRLDLYEQSVDWSRWGPEMIATCDFTLIVPSRAYRQRWDGRNPPSEGAGAAREINVLKGRFDKDQENWRARTIVIMMPGITSSDVPDEIYSSLQRFPVNPRTYEGMEPLLRHLTKQPEFRLPKRGAMPDLPPQPNAIRDDGLQSPRPEGITSPRRGETSWLPTATAHGDQVSRLAQDVEDANPPPVRPPGEVEPNEWMAILANWMDDTSSLVDEIERVRSLAPKDPSVRFVQALDNSRAGMQGIVDGLDGPRTIANVNRLADVAAELHELVKQLARLSLEP